jgi:hypothetical protein
MHANGINIMLSALPAVWHFELRQNLCVSSREVQKIIALVPITPPVPFFPPDQNGDTNDARSFQGFVTFYGMAFILALDNE